MPKSGTAFIIAQPFMIVEQGHTLLNLSFVMDSYLMTALYYLFMKFFVVEYKIVFSKYDMPMTQNLIPLNFDRFINKIKLFLFKGPYGTTAVSYF